MAKRLNILMFSGEYDKALAALILANTARQMEVDVPMFFAFWGLCLLRKDENKNLKGKSFYEKLFSIITSKGPDELLLYKMNFSGIGKAMMIENKLSGIPFGSGTRCEVLVKNKHMCKLTHLLSTVHMLILY